MSEEKIAGELSVCALFLLVIALCMCIQTCRGCEPADWSETPQEVPDGKE